MTRRAPLVASMLFALISPVTQAPAQQLVELAPGARVRIQAPGIVAGRYTGTVVSRTPDTVVVASSAAAAARVPISALTSVEVSRGKSRSQGALKGIVWGAPIGLVLGLLTASGIPQGESEGEYVGFSIAAGAIWGAIIGAIAGSERWDRYELPQRTSLVPALLPSGGARVGIRLAIGR